MKEVNKVIRAGVAGLAAMLVIVAIIFFAAPGMKGTVRAEESLRVDLSVINLEGDGRIHTQSEYWIRTAINAAADVSISGSGSSLQQPWLVLKIPKTSYISKPVFIDSQKAQRTLKYEDNDFYYILYQFDFLTGGTRMTFPFPFSFTADAPDQTELPVEVRLVSASDITGGQTMEAREAVETAYTLPVLAKADKTYVARNQMFLFEQSSLSVYKHANHLQDENIYVFRGAVENGAADTGEGAFFGLIRIHAIANIPKDVEGEYTIEKPLHTESEVILPEGMHPQYSLDGKNSSFDEGTRAYRVRNVNPNARGDIANAWHNFDIAFDDQPFNTPIELTFRVYVNRGEAGERRLPDQKVKVMFEPQYFAMRGGISYFKDNLHNYNGTEPFVYSLYEGMYTTDGKTIYDRRGADQTANGLYYSSIIKNENNGSGYGRPENGNVSDVYSIRDFVLDVNGNDHRLHYTSFMLYDHGASNHGTNYYTEEQKKEQASQLGERLATVGNVLYGIRRDGGEVELARNVRPNVRVPITDPDGELYSLRLDFAAPIRLNNTWFTYHVSALPVAEEMEKYADGTYTSRVSYYGQMGADTATGAVPTEQGRQYRHAGTTHVAVTSLAPVAPRSYLRLSNGHVDPVPVSFSAEGTYTKAYMYGDFRHGEWGPFAGEPVEDVQFIMLLPPEFSPAEGDFYNKNSWVLPVEKPEVIENFRNTGRTALIFRPGKEMVPNQEGSRFDILANLKISPYAKRGDNRIDYYVTYAHNDRIQPLNEAITYEDELDLDNDGDTDELFLHTYSTFNYIPPLELLISKQAGVYPENMGTTAVGDLGERMYYSITIFNNTISDARSVGIIDVLPYAGDHHIVADQSGLYADRGSAYGIQIDQALEEVEENAGLVDRFEFFYQVTPQGDDLESVRDGVWLSKEQVSDFSQVKSIKIRLKEGAVIASKEEVKIYIPGRMPKAIETPKTEPAINTAAVSTDGYLYGEGNKVQSYYETYLVRGVVFHDGNENGVYDASERVLAGRLVQLIDADTGEVKLDQWGKPYETRTKEDGTYEFPLHTRGRYRVRFAVPDGARFTSVPGTGESDNHVKMDPELPGESLMATITPSATTAVRNAGVLFPPVPVRDIPVAKKWTRHDGTALFGEELTELSVTAELLRDGEATGEEVTLHAGNDWTAVFVDLPDRAEYDSGPYVYTVREKGVDARGLIRLQDKWYKATTAGDETVGYVLYNRQQLAMIPLVPAKKIEEEKPEEPKPSIEEEKPEEPKPPTEEEKPEEPELPTEEEKPEEPELPTEEEKPEEPKLPTEEEKPEEPKFPVPEAIEKPGRAEQSAVPQTGDDDGFVARVFLLLTTVVIVGICIVSMLVSKHLSGKYKDRLRNNIKINKEDNNEEED